MEILCPNCQKRLTIGDEHAAKIMRCPMCMGMFTAPALPPSSIPPSSPAPAPAPPPPAPETISFQESAPPPPPPYVTAPASPPEPPAYGAAIVEARPPPPPTPPPPPGEYTGGFTLKLCPKVLAWIPPVCLVLLFVLSFLPWVYRPMLSLEDHASVNLWSLAFGRIVGSMDFVFYVLMTLFLGLPITVGLFLIFLKIIPLPPHVQPFVMWRPTVVVLFLLLGFLILLWNYALNTFATPWTLTSPWMTPWMRLAVCVHLVALVAAALECWLEFRKPKNLPMPKVEVKW